MTPKVEEILTSIDLTVAEVLEKLSESEKPDAEDKKEDEVLKGVISTLVELVNQLRAFKPVFNVPVPVVNNTFTPPAEEPEPRFKKWKVTYPTVYGQQTMTVEAIE